MTHHTRIRPFNTKDTYPEQDLDNDLCQAVVAGGVVYLRGQIGQDLDSRENVGIGDVEAQAEKAMANIAMLLEEAGGSLEDIVKVVVYLMDIRYREPVYRVMGRWLKGVYPVPPAGRLGAGPSRVAGRDRRDRGAPGGPSMTFSLAARDPLTGAFGMVISSSSPAVAARCASSGAGVGAVTSQNVTNPGSASAGWAARCRGRPPRSDRGSGVRRALPRLPPAGRRRPRGDGRDLRGLARAGDARRGGGTACVAAGNLLARPRASGGDGRGYRGQ